MPRKLRLEFLPLSHLRRAPKNPKDHDIGLIGGLMDEYGYTNPVLLNEADGMLLAGGGRLDTLQQKKARGERPPDGIQVLPDGDWGVPTICGINIPPGPRRDNYVVGDNNATIRGGWLEDILREVMSDSAAAAASGEIGEAQLATTGFDRAEIDAIIRGAGAPQPPGPQRGAEGDTAGRRNTTFECPNCGWSPDDPSA